MKLKFIKKIKEEELLAAQALEGGKKKGKGKGKDKKKKKK